MRQKDLTMKKQEVANLARMGLRKAAPVRLFFAESH
jgi:hypothetical protein